MSFEVDKNGNITLIQGDSGSLTITGLNTEYNYTVYLAIQDNERNVVADELQVNSNNQDSVVFEFSPEFTNLLKVPKGELFAVYFYGVKICLPSINYEDTLIIGNGDLGGINTIVVFPKKVEGA